MKAIHFASGKISVPVLLVIVTVFSLLGSLFASFTMAASADWDKSSIVVSGSCNGGDCTSGISAQFCNDGQDMQGTTTYNVWFSSTGNPKTGSTVASGTFPALKANGCTTLSYTPSQIGNYMFQVIQRPGHPGSDDVWSSQCQVTQCTPQSTPTPTQGPTATPTQGPTATPTTRPTSTPTPTTGPTATPTQGPTNTPNPTPTEGERECNPINGAIYTTDPQGNKVNGNIYDNKQDVYLQGGPNNGSGHAFPNGTYYYRVTDPSGAVILSTTRTIVITNGIFPGIQLYPYNDTPNPGGEYKVWVSTSPNFDPECSKTDNFKVKSATTPTPTPTPCVEGEGCPTPTPTQSPTSTPTPGPTNTPVPGPTNTPVPGPTATPGPGPTSTPGPNPTNPVTTSIVATNTPGQVLGITEQQNPVVKGVVKSFSGKVLGAATGPRTADTTNGVYPSDNELIKDTYVYIPKVNINEPIYQGIQVGQELVLGSKQVLETHIWNGKTLYEHNNGSFNRLQYLQKGDTVFYTANGTVTRYVVTSVSTVPETNIDAFKNATENDITLLTCDSYNFSRRVVVKATAVRE